MLQAGNIQTRSINTFLNRRVADSMGSLPASATQVLVFSTDFRAGQIMRTQLTREQGINKRWNFIQIYNSGFYEYL